MSKLNAGKKSRVDFGSFFKENLNMTKFKEYYNRMVEENKEAFDKFTQIHFEYSTDEEKYQDEFNKEGEKIQKIIHEWEDKLCSQSEKAGYGNYTGNLAEKFQEEVRHHFPLIDYIGIISKKSTFNVKKITPKVEFSLKKIKI